MALIRDITCKDVNAIIPEQLVTITGAHFQPGGRISPYDLQLQTLGGQDMGITLMHPYPDGKVLIEAGSDGTFTVIVEIPVRSLRKEDNYFVQAGNYRLRLRMKNGQEVITPITLVAPKKESPPVLPPVPKPEPPKPVPEPPKLPSGGNCDTNFSNNILHVCFFDGTGAPTTGSPTLAQFDQAVFSSPVGSWAGFQNDWGVGIVGSSGKSDHVSAVWRGKIHFKKGTYNFHTKSDDGIELKLDGTTVISNWNDHPIIQNDLNNISGGLVRDVQLRWYENGGGAAVGLWWALMAPAVPVVTPEPKHVAIPVPLQS